MDELELEKQFYRPFCSENEIERIFNVANAEDYLLKLRADYIADHIRHYRVMRRRMNKAGSAWSFSKHFSDREFANYISMLNESDQAKCNRIAKGFVFSSDPNGACIKTEFGNIVVNACLV